MCCAAPALSTRPVKLMRTVGQRVEDHASCPLLASHGVWNDIRKILSRGGDGDRHRRPWRLSREEAVRDPRRSSSATVAPGVSRQHRNGASPCSAAESFVARAAGREKAVRRPASVCMRARVCMQEHTPAVETFSHACIHARTHAMLACIKADIGIPCLHTYRQRHKGFPAHTRVIHAHE